MTIRVLYSQDEDTWVATSPDLPRWTAVADTYQQAHKLAEEGVRFALASDAEDRGESPPHDVGIEHYVPEGAVRQLAGAA